jgi:hypothetical protein
MVRMPMGLVLVFTSNEPIKLSLDVLVYYVMVLVLAF